MGMLRLSGGIGRLRRGIRRLRGCDSSLLYIVEIIADVDDLSVFLLIGPGGKARKTAVKHSRSQHLVVAVQFKLVSFFGTDPNHQLVVVTLYKPFTGAQVMGSCLVIPFYGGRKAAIGFDCNRAGPYIPCLRHCNAQIHMFDDLIIWLSNGLKKHPILTLFRLKSREKRP